VLVFTRVDSGLNAHLWQTEDCAIGICWFSARHSTLARVILVGSESG
jgi:hypothetical protein